MSDTQAPERICTWDIETYEDGEVTARGWTTSYPAGHSREYVRADLFDALTAERDALRAKIAAMKAPDNSRFEFHRGWNGAVAAILACIDNPTPRDETAI